MITQGRFLCGCNPAEKHHYSGDTAKSPIPGADPTYTDKRFDDEGFEVCPEHGERLYGWKSSDPKQPRYVKRDDKLPEFISPGRTIKKLDHSAEDKRDNRDPEIVYATMKAGSNGHGG